MLYYINEIIHNRLFITLIAFCIVILFFFVCVLIGDYFKRIIMKLLVVTYSIYFPAGLFMSIYYKMTANSWFPIGNEFTVIFLSLTICMLMILLTVWLISKVNYIPNNWFIRGESLEDRETFFMGFTLLLNIIASIYVYICFAKLFIKWIA